MLNLKELKVTCLSREPLGVIMDAYDVVELKEDLNPVIRKGMKGTVLLRHDSNNVEVEFVNDDGTNVEYNGQATFTISIHLLHEVWNDPSKG